MQDLTSSSSPPTLGPIGTRALPELIVRQLTHAILEGALRPGERLVERDLAARFQVSKTPVREALKEMRRRRLVTSRTYRTTEVVTITSQMISDIYQVRAALETEAVRAAVPRHTPESCDAMEGILESAAVAAGSNDLVELTWANRQFHASLCGPCGNELLTALLEELRDQVAFITVSGWRSDPTWRNEISEHTTILGAVRRGAADEAATLLRGHIEGARSRLISSLESNPQMEESVYESV